MDIINILIKNKKIKTSNYVTESNYVKVKERVNTDGKRCRIYKLSFESDMCK